jgi:hypothetical protein
VELALLKIADIVLLGYKNGLGLQKLFFRKVACLELEFTPRLLN